MQDRIPLRHHAACLLPWIHNDIRKVVIENNVKMGMFFVIIIIIIDITIIVIAFLLSSGKDDNLCRLAEFKWYHLIESLSRRSKQKSCLIYLFLIVRALSDQFTFCLRLQSVNNGDSASRKGIVGKLRRVRRRSLDSERAGASRIRLTKTPADKPLPQVLERKKREQCRQTGEHGRF